MRRGRLHVIVPAVVGTVALAIVIVLLLRGLNGASGGASSPLAAVRELAVAVERKDTAAAISLVDPGEARTLGTLYEKTRIEARSGSGDGSGSPSGVGTSHVSIKGLTLDAQRMGRGVARVRIDGGRLDGALDAVGLPASLGARSGSRSSTNLARASGPDGAGLFLMVREDDGRWYISPTLTILQYVDEIDALAAPDFSTLEEGGQSHPPTTTKRLMSELAGAVSASDVSGTIALIAGSEASALRPYEVALQELVDRIEGSLHASMRDLQFTETNLGSGLVRLNLLHAGFHLRVNSDSAPFVESVAVDGTLNGPCVSVTSGGKGGCFSKMRRLLGVDDFFLVAERTEGGLRLAPIATVLEYAHLLLNRLEGPGVRRLLGEVHGEAPVAELKPGVEVHGRLNSAGYASLAYDAGARGLLAIDSGRNIAVLAPDGRPLLPLACPDRSRLYRLGSAGRYQVVLSTNEYEPGTYSAIAEPVMPSSVKLPSKVSGSIGDGARIAALSFAMPGEGVTFETTSAVSSQIVGSHEGLFNGCGWAGMEDGLGLGSLFEPRPSGFEPIYDPEAGNGSTSKFGGGGDYYLVVSGGAGSSFSGRLVTGAEGYE